MIESDHQGALIFGQNKEGQYRCNEFIFGHKGQPSDYTKNLLQNGFVISTVFKKNIALIKKLQRKGIQVIFTWPVVVGKDCYPKKYAILFESFIKEIKYYLAENNIVIIGEPNDSLFPTQYMFDSYYHIIPIARDNRTRILITQLKKIITKRKTQKLTLNSTILKINLIRPLLNSLVKVDNEIIKLNTQGRKIIFANGWYAIEEWGVWSKNSESVLYVKLATSLLQQNLKLAIENNLYGTQDKTTVLINDKKLGDYLLEGKKSIIIPKQFLVNKDGLVKIQFNHFNVKSPLEYGLNHDDRKIKFGLKSLQFKRFKSNE